MSPNQRSTAVGEHLALLTTELTLAAVSLAAIVGFERLFSDDSWRRPIIVAAIFAHGTAMVLRRFRVPLWLSAPTFVAVGALALTHLHYGDSTRRWLPTRATLDTVGTDLDVASEVFPNAIAPTAALTGFVVAAAAAVWILAGVADLIAFRFRLTLVALAPAATIIVFQASLGSDNRRAPLLMLALTAALVFLVTHRSLLYPTEHAWLGNLTDARSAVARFATPVAVLAGLFTIAALPLVPGASDSLVDLNSGGPGEPARVVISPLVDIRGRLVNQADVEVFQVRSTEPSYWRLTSLDKFDNQVWSSRADYGNAGGDLDVEVQTGNTTRDVSQQYRIEALAAVWLPAAFQPTNINNLSEAGLSWEPASATLIVDRSRSVSDGIEYTVESSVPDFGAGELAALPLGHPTEFDRYTELPEDFSPFARGLAADIIAGASTPYEMSLALQDFFRNEFRYDINVTQGHDIDRIEDFLNVRVGYCEQFAGTFAAMARSLGLPARVAVGFTWGDTDPNDPNLYRVRGEHAHAWPEVFITGAGWVAFEPTPGRGAPSAEGYTNITAAQDETGLSAEVAESTLNPALREFPQDILERLEGLEDTSGLAAGTGGSAGEANPFRVPGWLIAVGSVLAAMAAAVAMFPLVRRAIRNRQHKHADPERHRVLKAWDGVVDSVAPLGIKPSSAETTSEFVGRVAPVLGPRPELDQLAGAVDHARYSPSPIGDSAVSQAEATHESVATLVRVRTSWWQRYRAEFDFSSVANRN